MESTTLDEETGEERKRMINKMRWKGYGPASIMFSDENVKQVVLFIIHIFSNDFASLYRSPQSLLNPLKTEEVRSMKAC